MNMHTQSTGDGPRRRSVARREALSGQVLPLTPKMVAILQTEAANERGCGKTCATASLIAAGVIALLSVAHVLDWDPLGIVLLGGFAAVITTLFGVIRENIVRADIRGGVYRRIAGPLTFEENQGEEGSVTYSYHVDGKSFPLSLHEYRRLRHVTWASVEYAPHCRKVFALRDVEGAILYYQDP
jgi:hypothetical protein